MRSLLIIGAAAAVLAVFLVRNDREAKATVRAEDEAIERLLALAAAPPAPPHSAGGYRFEWAEGGDLPALLLALPDGAGFSLFAAAKGGAVYAFELFGAPPPDVTPLRILAAKGEDGSGLPPGWRRIR